MKAQDLRLKELVAFEDGRIDLHGRRLVLHSIDAFAHFRKDLVEMVGLEQARRILTRFEKLAVNFLTREGGSVRVELQDAEGRPIERFTLADSTELRGDAIEKTVGWKGGDDVSALAGKPIRLRLELKNADLFSFRFWE